MQQNNRLWVTLNIEGDHLVFTFFICCDSIFSGDDMNSLEIQFIDTYKSLEKLCNDMYGEKGVSVYIQTMESVCSQQKRSIAGWDDFYYTLKRLRWLRNQIVHPSDVDYEVTEKNIFDTQRIYNDLLCRKDPLAILHQREVARQARKPIVPVAPQESDSNTNNNRLSAPTLAIVIILLMLVFIGYILWTFGHN